MNSKIRATIIVSVLTLTCVFFYAYFISTLNYLTVVKTVKIGSLEKYVQLIKVEAALDFGYVAYVYQNSGSDRIFNVYRPYVAEFKDVYDPNLIKIAVVGDCFYLENRSKGKMLLNVGPWSKLMNNWFCYETPTR